MSQAAEPSRKSGLLDAIEWVGNKLPDPVLLFLGGALLIMGLSHVAAVTGWEVQPKTAVQAVDPDSGEKILELADKGAPLTAKSLLTSDGLYWALESMVDNFMGFAPLGVVLTGMLGIGVAERTGMLGAMLKAFMLVVPKYLLTPTMVFLGIMSSMGLDAGYVVLPPLAAALYISVGRSPLAGIAAVFAGVAAGFNANLFITGLDPMLADLSTIGAQVIDPGYEVAATCNWWFAIASTVVITLTGWGVSSFFVERRLKTKPAEDGGPTEVSSEHLESQRLTREETRSLAFAAITLVGLVALTVGLTLIPNSPLFDHTMPAAMSGDAAEQTVLADVVGEMDPAEIPADAVRVAGGAFLADGTFVNADGQILAERSPPFARWVSIVTPLIFLVFILPGVVYGIAMRTIKTSKDAAKLMIDALAAMAPIIVLAFFAAQFIEYLKWSQMDRMLAFWGGEILFDAGLSRGPLLIAFIFVTMLFNLFVGSMSAKYTMFAPIFIPMLMVVGISPELTQATYRIGDSVTNVITPLNAYLVIVLVFMRQHAPKAGMGTLIAMMMPYTVAFTLVWAVMLLLWMQFGIPLGINGPLEYIPSSAAG